MKKEQSVRSSDLKHNFGEEKLKAYGGPLMITSYGRIEFVFMTIKDYEQLKKDAKK